MPEQIQIQIQIQIIAPFVLTSIARSSCQDANTITCLYKQGHAMVNPIVLHNWTKLSKSGQTLVNWQKKSKFTQYEAILDKLSKNNQTLQKVQSSPCLNHTIMVIIIIVINMKQIYRAL